NIINVLQRNTKLPLPLFFIGVKPLYQQQRHFQNRPILSLINKNRKALRTLLASSILSLPRLWSHKNLFASSTTFPVILNEKIIPKVDSVKYFANIATHIKIKTKSLNFKLHKFRHLLRSNITLMNKLFARLYLMIYDFGDLPIFLSSIFFKNFTLCYVSYLSLHNDLSICTCPLG
ncbi:putative RNA-directed DNA polymerase, partial [Aphis craccivora]